MSVVAVGWVPVFMALAFVAGVFVGYWDGDMREGSAQVSETPDTDPRE